MFSEYASRFLAQSQSRPNATQQQHQRDNSSPSRQQSQNQSNSRFGGRGVFRSNMLGPYSQTSRFPFASRTQAAQAPLFASTADDFREEEDGEEHQRDVADFYALQSSRKAFRASHLTDSSEADDYVDHSSQADETASHDSDNDSPFRRPRPRAQGIRSSWRGTRPDSRGRPSKPSTMQSVLEEQRPQSQSSWPSQSSKGKDRLVNVDLTASEHSSIDDMDQDDDYGPQDSAPAYSGFHFKSQKLKESELDDQLDEPQTDDETARLYQRPSSPDQGLDRGMPLIEEEEEETVVESPKHDSFWGNLFLIAFASLFASAFLVYLHTDEPGLKNPLGDTIYTILRQKYFLLAVDTLIATIVAAVWLALLRSYHRPLTYLTIMAVPVLLFSFFLWPFITSLKKHSTPLNTQYTFMRFFSFIPLLGGVIWAYLAYQSRRSIERSIEILELASKILSASPSLIAAGFAALSATVIWFWLWLTMFTRVFLEGHMARKLFIIDTSTWYLGVFFFVMLLWTQLVIAGIQRATTAATVSQWYFYRSSDTSVSSREVVTASFNHATGPLFGTICLSTLTSLLIRLPLIILPRRFTGMLSLCIYTFIPAPLKSLTTPITLTYAAIHSQPLAIAARGVSRLPLTTNQHPSHFSTIHRHADPLTAYNTTHMLLHATRQIMSLALGLGAWLSTTSAYGYIVGLGAAVVGWGILGAVEGIVGGVVDGVLVCWASEVAAGRPGRFCPEAKQLFGNQGVERHGGRIMV